MKNRSYHRKPGTDGGSRLRSGFLRYLRDEIAIEYKSCLYFFAILFFYCVCLVCRGIYSADMLHMAEIMLTAYGIGYLQVYGLHNFDEAEELGKREGFSMFFCTGLYTATSFGFGWFGRNIAATVVFYIYMLFGYWCVYLINKIKRKIDTENLNWMLTEFKKDIG